MRHRSLERCATVLSSVRKTRHCTLDFLASKAKERAIGRGASAQDRCAPAYRVASGYRVAAADPLQSFVAGLSVSALQRVRSATIGGCFTMLRPMQSSGPAWCTSVNGRCTRYCSRRTRGGSRYPSDRFSIALTCRNNPLATSKVLY